MNKILTILGAAAFLCLFNSCSDKTEQLEARIDSLEHNAYKPGFGEFMTYVQIHHDKLWFAGQNENWKLADFELNEIKEAIGDIQKYEKDRKESQMVIMLSPSLDSVNLSIEQKSPALFKITYTALTNKCNTCHKLVNYGFNQVKIPDTPPFSNQIFKEDTTK